MQRICVCSTKKSEFRGEKQEYVFQFTGSDGLTQLNNGTGRDKRIFFSAVDYEVVSNRQEYGEATGPLSEKYK